MVFHCWCPAWTEDLVECMSLCFLLSSINVQQYCAENVRLRFLPGLYCMCSTREIFVTAEGMRSGNAKNIPCRRSSSAGETSGSASSAREMCSIVARRSRERLIVSCRSCLSRVRHKYGLPFLLLFCRTADNHRQAAFARNTERPSRYDDREQSKKDKYATF